jgi:hypothetical protein
MAAINLQVDITKGLAGVQAAGKAYVSAAYGSLYRFGERIMTISKQRDCPVNHGTLRSTGHVELPTKTGNVIIVRLAYGGPAAPYATFVHERLHVHHPVGRAKYLEIPVMEGARVMRDFLAAEIKAEVGA